jgi:glutamate formiminotransferase/formiminotetrahydrofolate cyclodeaminase
MPKGSPAEKEARMQAIEEATKYATEIPFQVMDTAFQSMEVAQAMLKHGLQSSLSDAGVGILCARAAVLGAYFNVRINAKDIIDRDFADKILSKAEHIYQETLKIERETIAYIDSKM